MFPNLEAEMARSKITQAKLAEMLGVTPTTLSFKLSGTLNVDDSNKVMKIGKMRIKFGSWVAIGGGKSYVKMVDEADLKRILEIEGNFIQSKFACFVMNGEGAASPLNSVGTQWWVNDGLYCYFDGNLATGARYRINFIYLYFDDYTPISG